MTTTAWLVISGLTLLVVLLGIALWSLTHARSGRWEMLSELNARTERFPHLAANLCLASPCEGNSFSWLLNGRFWTGLREAMEDATETIHLETFLWETGELSQSLVEVMTARARAGIEVRMIIDSVGGGDMKDSERKALREAGVDLQFFRPRTIRHVGTANGRDHRKLVVIDGRVAFVGGHCVADNWQGDAERRDCVRDTSARIEGPLVADVQRAFAENWTEVTGELLADPKHFPELHAAGDVCAFVAYISFEQRVSTVKTLHMLAVAAARDTLLIQNPYFILDRGAQDTLIRAAQRGTRVRVMVPAREATDARVVFHAMRHGLRPLLEAGIEIYTYERCLLHHKLVVVDGHWAIFGSTNFDFRSFELNEEISVSAFDRAVAGELARGFEDDLRSCSRFTVEDLDKRNLLGWASDFMAWTVRAQL